jgi:DNA-binding MarR family transcriptional regulator
MGGNMDCIPLEEIGGTLNDLTWTILKIIQEHSGITYTEILKISNTAKDKCRIEIARLEGARLIESHRDPLDQRHLPFKVTQYGEKLLDLFKNKIQFSANF